MMLFLEVMFRLLLYPFMCYVTILGRYPISGIVSPSARNLDVLEIYALNLVNSLLMGNKRSVKLNASITACSLEKKRGRNMEKTLSSIMENGHSGVSLGFRFFQSLAKVR